MTDAIELDVVVVGTGVAGLSAARECLHAGLRTATLESNLFGGMILTVNELDGAISGNGATFAADLMTEVADLGGESIMTGASAVESDSDGLVVSSELGRHAAHAVIVASGAERKRLGVPGEAELEHKGVGHCADCDGPFFVDRRVAVAGGGDSALQSALILSQYCSAISILQRDDALVAQRHFVDAVDAAANIEVYTNADITEVLGNGQVEGVRVNGDVVACDGFFPFIGLSPVSAFLPAHVTRDRRGAVITSDDLETHVPNVYAAGAVRAGCGGSIEDAVADGVTAARSVAARLQR